MKRIIIFFAFCLFLNNIYAQKTDKKYSGGLFFTPGISWLKPQNSKDATSLGTGFNYKFGSELDVHAGENFAFCFSLQYASYNGKIKMDSLVKFKTAEQAYTDTFRNAQMFFKLGYLELPISMKGIAKMNNIAFFFKAGGHLGMRVSVPKANLISDNKGEISDVIVTDQVSFLNLGWHMGGGIEYTLTGNMRFVAELLYNGGFWPVLNCEKIKQAKSMEPKIFLNDVSLKLGILF